MDCLKNEQIEKIAADTFTRYKTYLHYEWDVICVNPLALAEMLGYKVLFLDYGEDSDTLGLTVFQDMTVEITEANGNHRELNLDNKTIIINESLKNVCIGRYNFTIMHEICHHIINDIFSLEYHIKYRNLPHIEKRENQYRSLDCDEYMANKLAAAILMPQEILKIVFRNLFGKTYVKRINSILDREYYKKFCAIAKLFGVSKEALAIRLKNLNMIGEYQYTTYNEILDVFPEPSIA